MSMDKDNKFRALRWTLVALFICGELALIAYGIKGSIIPEKIREVPEYASWDEEVVEEAGQIPVQDGGRVKPFSTLARFKLLSFLGATKMKIEVGERKVKIGPTEWLLDCLFRPELARQLPVFRVDDTNLLHGLGIRPDERRARLSYNDFNKDYGKGPDGVDRLMERVREIQKEAQLEQDRRATMTPKQIRDEDYSRTADERNVDERAEKKSEFLVELAGKIRDYELLTGFLDFARTEVDPPGIPESFFGQDDLDPTRLSTWVGRFDRLRVLLEIVRQQGRESIPEVDQLLVLIEQKVNLARGGVKWLPPRNESTEEWWSVGDQIISVLEDRSFRWETLQEDLKKLEELKADGREVPKELKAVARWSGVLNDMRGLEELVMASGKNNSNEFANKLAAWKGEITERAESRGEAGGIAGEVSYYQRNYFMNALVMFLAAFVISAFGWLVSGGKIETGIRWGSILFYVGGFLYLAVGIAHRSFLMGRPPVGNLYDTIPFITAGATLVLGIAEWLTRRKLLLSMGAILGVAGLFLAFRYEAGNADDHMDPLVAVLKSNYWLATHVVTVVIGYSGGLMACFLSVVFVHMRLAGLAKDEKSFTRFMTRAVYGVVCFTLLFSLVGTVLGGIWANDSWGRFWGWDPKENGALLIVLWSLIILHSRMAGWLKDWGMHLCSIFGGAVVGFSWWHVNMLEVGLHSYGFISGGQVIWYYYIACLIAFLVGVAGWFVDRLRKNEMKREREALVPSQAKKVTS